jgi:hypothetical protein
MTARTRQPHIAAVPHRTELSDEQRADKFLAELDDNMLYCRAMRRHRYPVLLPPKRGKRMNLPKGLSFEPIKGQPGFVLKTEVCEICGRSSVTTTTYDEFLTRRDKRKYEDPAGYAAPKGTGPALQGQVAAHELERRLAEGGLFGMPGR